MKSVIVFIGFLMVSGVSYAAGCNGDTDQSASIDAINKQQAKDELYGGLKGEVVAYKDSLHQISAEGEWNTDDGSWGVFGKYQFNAWEWLQNKRRK